MALLSGLVVLALASCQKSPAPNQAGGGGGGTPTPTPTPTQSVSPTPTPAPKTGTVLDLDWSTASATPFVDPTTPTDQQSGRYFTGNWSVQKGMYTQSTPPSNAQLSFREYDGNAFGLPNGNAPAHYRVDAEMMAVQPSASSSSFVGAPTGMLALIPYYLDSTHYILLDALPNEAECWFVDGLAPGDQWDASKYRVWNKDLSTPIQVGQKVQWGAEINTQADTVSIYWNGQLQQTVPGGAFIQPGVMHGISLASNGNYVGYDWFKLTAF